MDTQYETFINVLGTLGTLVVVATFVERILAFIFEHEWFRRLFMHMKPDPNDASKTKLVSKIPGLKGLIALALSIFICFRYKFDVLHVLFMTANKDEIGQIFTGFVVAGGSAGAIAIFQGYLNLNKDSRDAMISARKAQSDSAKQVAENMAKETEAKLKTEEAKLKTEETKRKAAEKKAHGERSTA